MFWCLSRLGLHKLAIMCPLQLKPGLAHRWLATVGEPIREKLLPCFVLEIYTSPVVQLLMVIHKVHNCLLIQFS